MSSRGRIVGDGDRDVWALLRTKAPQFVVLAALLGAVGISGDVSDADEAAAIAGIEAAGLVADPGSD